MVVTEGYECKRHKTYRKRLSSKKPNRTFYHDRMFSWDEEKYNRAAIEVFGRNLQSFYICSEKDIEAFLKKYFEEDLELVSVSCDINTSNGYDIWRFDCYIKKG